MTEQTTTPPVEVVTPSAPPVAPELLTPAPPAPPEAPKPAEPSQDAKFTPTGDPRLDLAMDFFVGAGLTEDSYELQAAAQGDFGALKAALSKSGKAGWENYLSLAEQGYEDFQKAETAAQEAREKTVYDAVGGKEAFEEVALWVKENAAEEEKTSIKAAFQAGGMQAVAMATFLKHQMVGAPGVSVSGESAVADSAPYKVQKSQPQKTYNEAVRELRNRIGAHAMDSSPEYHKLRQQYGAR